MASTAIDSEIDLVNRPNTSLSSRHSALSLKKWAVGKAVRAGLAVEGAYLNRYVTDEQRSRRPIFIATLWAGASRIYRKRNKRASD